jgi:hypothetical protein
LRRFSIQRKTWLERFLSQLSNVSGMIRTLGWKLKSDVVLESGCSAGVRELCGQQIASMKQLDLV